ISKPSSFSFPSGHTGFSFAATGVLAKYFRKYRIPLFILASLMAFSRVYLCVHYPSDIIGGIILGLICSQISIWVFDRESESAGISM
ncbi:MAG: phosphatase PAP2 family protein, partial [Clostridiales bacterium]|nr:phosphatase PAP2 family protein [Clostridiales bacterium]